MSLGGIVRDLIVAEVHDEANADIQRQDVEPDFVVCCYGCEVVGGRLKSRAGRGP